VDRFVLWDIDGTLVSVGGIGGEVFDRAIEAVLGQRPPERVHMSGKTDPQIVGEYLEMLGVADPQSQVATVLEHLERELAAAEHEMRGGGRMLPGVTDVIDGVRRKGTTIQSVLTGNIAPNARLKLDAFGLADLLDLEVGAYGSDHADRRLLVPVALARLAELRGVELSASQVWIVGDSANDLACARAAGARCLLVATGRASLDDLEALGPDAACADLTDTDTVVALLAS
jgi:phosphoglycolate phosphatase-like HAD superfamily hydrolase